MRIKTITIAVLAMLLLTTGVVLAAQPVHQVSGGGRTNFEDLGLGTESYGFTARLDASGEVSGQAELHFVSPPGNFHADITCLAVDGITAWLGMTVTRSDNPVWPVGTDLTWQVQDNGEGKNADPDLQSFFFDDPTLEIFFPGTEDCNEMPALLELGNFAWDNGNIQVDQSKKNK